MAKPVWTLDQIVDNLNRNGEFWTGSTISFSFAETLPVEYNGVGLSFSSFNSAQRTAAREAMKLWDDVMAVSLVETSGPSGDIQLFNSDLTEVAGAFLPNTVIEGLDVSGDIHFNSSYFYNSQLGYDDYGFLTIIHEIGHALGLEHPGEYNAGSGQNITYSNSAEYSQDSLQNTVMSYFGAYNTGADHYANGDVRYAASPLLHDIAAVQAVYGADMTTRTGDTVYGFNSTAGRDAFDFDINNTPVVAIWDAGGVDTIDFSGFSAATRINLQEGHFSSTPYMKNNVAIAYGAVIENAIGGSGDDVIVGNDVANVLEGGAGSNTLIGNGGDDTILGGRDFDQVWAGDGNDLVMLGSGNDQTFAHAGDDTVYGGDGRDQLNGGLGNDTIYGGSGNDGIYGHKDNDVLYGEHGRDSINGSDGDDTIYGGWDLDSLVGGSGDDTIFGGHGNDHIEGGDGVDTVGFEGAYADYEIVRLFTGQINVTDRDRLYGEGTDYLKSGVEWLQFSDQAVATTDIAIPPVPEFVLEGTPNSDHLRGNIKDDTLSGLAGNDTLTGDAGDDTLIGGAGNDWIRGGDGVDTAVFEAGRNSYWITYDAQNRAIVEYIGRNSSYAGRDIISTDTEWFQFANGTWLATDLPENVEPPVYLRANSNGGALSGGGGDDTIIGANGNDRFYGYDGNDYLNAKGGNNRVYGGAGNDRLYSSSGRDRLYGEDGNDYLRSGGGNDRVYGGEGDDRIIGSSGNDSLFGQGGNDYINAGSGNDRADGGTGNDYILGKSGHDRLYGRDGDDTMTGGSGNDRMYGHAGDDTISGNSGHDRLYGYDGDDVMSGSSGNDRMYGHAGDDYMSGGSGHDRMYGYDDNDYMVGGSGDDRMYAHAGNDYLNGGSGKNRLYGGDGNDTLVGGRHVDKLYGQSGDDTLTGGGGRDTMIGGSGNDTYFTDGRDTIRESFDQGVDTVIVGRSFSLGSNLENLDLTGSSHINGSGNSLNNYLWGNSGNNGLFGGDGEDTLDGWLGNDFLVGGDDSDVFLFGLGEDEGEDIILDFDRSEDVLAFDDVVDGPGDDLADIDAQIVSIVNQGDGGDVVVEFASGTDVTFRDLGSGAAGNLGSIADLVDDASTQIATASAAGLSAGSVLETVYVDPADYIVQVD